MTLGEIADCLALPKTTVYYWIKDLPLPTRVTGWPESARRKGNNAMKAKYRRLRDGAYEQGQREYDGLIAVPTFRDFVVLYIAEGYKRDRNTASVSNSDPRIITLSARWLGELSGRVPVVRVQYHADQDPEELRAFWAAAVGSGVDAVRLFPKSNSGQLRGRVWRCKYGVAAVQVYDTLLRARIQAWMDLVMAGW